VRAENYVGSITTSLRGTGSLPAQSSQKLCLLLGQQQLLDGPALLRVRFRLKQLLEVLDIRLRNLLGHVMDAFLAFHSGFDLYLPTAAWPASSSSRKERPV